MVLEKHLFVSERLLTVSGEVSGGVLVNEEGTIEDVLSREDADRLANDNKGKLKVTDFGGLVLMAGVVDSHVHVNEPGRTAWEGFRTATEAAAVGGITTIVDMPLLEAITPKGGYKHLRVTDCFRNSIPPTTTVENLKEKASSAKGNVHVDVGFWGGVIPGNQDCLKDLVEAGVVGFKCFLCPSGVDEFPNVDAKDLEKAFNALEGTGSVLAFHAEIEDQKPTKSKKKKKDPEEYDTYLESRPPNMELNAIKLIKSLIPKTDVRIHIVHVSSAEVVPILAEARRERQELGNQTWRAGVTAETCHHYLNLAAEQVPKGRSEYKCAPPIRDNSNKEKLWEYLLQDKLDLVVSDHSPCTPELKCANNLEAWGGISSVQFGLSLFWTAASARGLGLETVTKYLSEGPAMLCGLQDRKGVLKPGLDADILVFNPNKTFTVTTDIIRHKNKLTPYVGKQLKGVVVKTYLRGQLIQEDGLVLDEPKGKLLIKN